MIAGVHCLTWLAALHLPSHVMRISLLPIREALELRLNPQLEDLNLTDGHCEAYLFVCLV